LNIPPYFGFCPFRYIRTHHLFVSLCQLTPLYCAVFSVFSHTKYSNFLRCMKWHQIPELWTISKIYIHERFFFVKVNTKIVRCLIWNIVLG
jgi:hypothetical protein